MEQELQELIAQLRQEGKSDDEIRQAVQSRKVELETTNQTPLTEEQSQTQSTQYISGDFSAFRAGESDVVEEPDPIIDKNNQELSTYLASLRREGKSDNEIRSLMKQKKVELESAPEEEVEDVEADEVAPIDPLEKVYQDWKQFTDVSNDEIKAERLSKGKSYPDLIKKMYNGFQNVYNNTQDQDRIDASRDALNKAVRNFNKSFKTEIDFNRINEEGYLEGIVGDDENILKHITDLDVANETSSLHDNRSRDYLEELSTSERKEMLQYIGAQQDKEEGEIGTIGFVAGKKTEELNKLDKEIQLMVKSYENAKANNQVPSDQFFTDFQTKIDKLKELDSERANLFSQYEKKHKGILKRDQAIDAFRRTYSNWDQFSISSQKYMTSQAIGLFGSGEEGERSALQEAHEYYTELSEDYLPKHISITDVRNASDFIHAAESTIMSNAMPILQTIMTQNPNASGGLIGLSGYGSKLGDLTLEKDKANEILPKLKEELARLEKSDEEGSELEAQLIKDEISYLEDVVGKSVLDHAKHSLLYGLGEAIPERFTSIKIFDDMFRLNKSYIPKSLFSKTSRQYASRVVRKGGNTLSNVGLEVGGEVSTQLIQNYSDIVLGGEDKSIADGAPDAAFGGFLLAGAMNTTSGARNIGGSLLNTLTDSRLKSKLGSNAEKLFDLLHQYNAKGVSRADRLEIAKRVQGIIKDTGVTEKEVYNGLRHMSVDGLKEVFEIDRQKRQVIRDYRGVAKSGLSDGLKEDYKTQLQTKFDDLTRDQNTLLYTEEKVDNNLKTEGEISAKANSLSQEIEYLNRAENALINKINEMRDQGKDSTIVEDRLEDLKARRDGRTELLDQYNSKLESFVEEGGEGKSVPTPKREGRSPKIQKKLGDLTKSQLAARKEEKKGALSALKNVRAEKKTTEGKAPKAKQKVDLPSTATTNELSWDHSKTTEVITDFNGRVLRVVDRKTGKDVSEATRSKAEKSFISQRDFSQGRSAYDGAVAADFAGYTPEQHREIISEDSQNPLEVAFALQEELERDRDSKGYEEEIIIDNLKITREDFAHYGDANWLEDIGQFWFRRGKNTFDTDLDELNNQFGTNISPDRAIDIIHHYGKTAKKFTPKISGLAKDLKGRFYQLTGLEATTSNVSAVINQNPSSLKDIGEPLEATKERAKQKKEWLTYLDGAIDTLQEKYNKADGSAPLYSSIIPIPTSKAFIRAAIDGVKFARFLVESGYSLLEAAQRSYGNVKEFISQSQWNNYLAEEVINKPERERQRIEKEKKKEEDKKKRQEITEQKKLEEKIQKLENQRSKIDPDGVDHYEYTKLTAKIEAIRQGQLLQDKKAPAQKKIEYTQATDQSIAGIDQDTANKVFDDALNDIHKEIFKGVGRGVHGIPKLMASKDAELITFFTGVTLSEVLGTDKDGNLKGLPRFIDLVKPIGYSVLTAEELGVGRGEREANAVRAGWIAITPMIRSGKITPIKIDGELFFEITDLAYANGLIAGSFLRAGKKASYKLATTGDAVLFENGQTVNSLGMNLVSKMNPEIEAQPEKVTKAVNEAINTKFEVPQRSLDLIKSLRSTDYFQSKFKKKGFNEDQIRHEMNKIDFAISEADRVSGARKGFSIYLNTASSGRLNVQSIGLTHQGADFQKSLFGFKERSANGAWGWVRTLSQAAELYGYKESDDIVDRMKFSYSMIDDFLRWSADPIGTIDEWIGKVKKPHMFFNTIDEIYNAVKSGDVLTYESNLFTNLDSSTSGPHIMSGMTADPLGGEHTNWTGSKDRGDIYGRGVGIEVIDGLIDFAIDQNWETTFTPSDADLQKMSELGGHLAALYQARNKAMLRPDGKTKNKQAIRLANRYKKAKKLEKLTIRLTPEAKKIINSREEIVAFEKRFNDPKLRKSGDAWMEKFDGFTLSEAKRQATNSMFAQKYAIDIFRDIMKSPVMTGYYGAGAMKMAEKLVSILKHETFTSPEGVEVRPFKDINVSYAAILAGDVIGKLNEIAPGSAAYMSTLSRLSMDLFHSKIDAEIINEIGIRTYNSLASKDLEKARSKKKKEVAKKIDEFGVSVYGKDAWENKLKDNRELARWEIIQQNNQFNYEGETLGGVGSASGFIWKMNKTDYVTDTSVQLKNPKSTGPKNFRPRLIVAETGKNLNGTRDGASPTSIQFNESQLVHKSFLEFKSPLATNQDNFASTPGNSEVLEQFLGQGSYDLYSPEQLAKFFKEAVKNVPHLKWNSYYDQAYQGGLDRKGIFKDPFPYGAGNTNLEVEDMTIEEAIINKQKKQDLLNAFEKSSIKPDQVAKHVTDVLDHNIGDNGVYFKSDEKC